MNGFDWTHAAITLGAYLGSGYGIGEYFGKLLAFGYTSDRDYWGDFGACLGGSFGLLLWASSILAMVIS